MLNFVCVNAGNYQGRGSEYVNILFDMIWRNLEDGYLGKFICFTDDPTGLDINIEARELPPGLNGWWNKLYLFKEGVFKEGERVLYFDLDTLIVSGIEEIAAYDGEFALLRDFYRPYGFGSGVMAFKGGFGAHLWDKWDKAGRPEISGGDQAWIEANQEKPELLQDVFPDLFTSYKVSDGDVPIKASVVCFHGKPRPHEVVTGWVPLVWKIDGLARAGLENICNTELAKVHGQIESSSKRKLPWLDRLEDHERHVCIVGGGPSVADSINELKAMRGFGHQIWALNNTHDWLLANGIIPHACVLLDAREENAKFVANAKNDIRYYVASQCHPSMFDALEGKDVVLYHNASQGAQELLEKISPHDKYHLLGGGTTVGMKAIVVARFLGFKKFHLYGFDSSYRDDKGHAYEQKINDSDRVMDIVCEGRTFKCAPWMVAQANDFQELVGMLIQQDCLVTVSGDGLIPYIARLMGRQEAA